MVVGGACVVACVVVGGHEWLLGGMHGFGVCVHGCRGYVWLGDVHGIQRDTVMS